MAVLPQVTRHSRACQKFTKVSINRYNSSGYLSVKRHHSVMNQGMCLSSLIKLNGSQRFSIQSHDVRKYLSRGVHTLPFRTDRYQGVHVDLGDVPEYVTPQQFEVVLKGSMEVWRKTSKSAVWLKVPMLMGYIIPVASKYGFEFHHAEGDTALLCIWLKEKVPNKLPPFATHQVGVSGVVIKEDTNEVLVVRDRNRPFTLWKFPGGLANLGEDIAGTAEREIWEETGIQTEFRGVLGFRQQHNHPNAFGRSDLFFICHMIPLTFDLVPCHDEIEACQWMHLNELEECTQTSAITQRMVRLIHIGLRRGFEHVDLKADRFKSVYKGLSFKMYNRWLPKDEEEERRGYQHSIAGPEQLWDKGMYNVAEASK